MKDWVCGRGVMNGREHSLCLLVCLLLFTLPWPPTLPPSLHSPFRCLFVTPMFLEPICLHGVVSCFVYHVSLTYVRYLFLSPWCARSVLSPVLFSVWGLWRVGTFEKILTVLLKHRCGPTTAFVNAGGLDLFRKMVRHLGSFSIMQVAKLLLLPKYAALQGKWGPFVVVRSV